MKTKAKIIKNQQIPDFKNKGLKPSGMLSDLRTLDNKRDVPYQSLLKIFLAERLEKEMRPHT